MSKLKLKALTDASFKKNPALAKEVAEWVQDVDNLESIDEVVLDKKKTTLSLAA